MLCSFVTIPISILLTIHLRLNKVEFEKNDYISLSVMAVSVLILLVLRFGMFDFFDWIMD